MHLCSLSCVLLTTFNTLLTFGFFQTQTQIDALRETLSSLQNFLEVHPSTITEDIECMVRKIPRVTYDAEISIHNYVADRLYKELHPQNNAVGCCSIDPIHDEIHRVVQEIAPINEALKTLSTMQRRPQEQPARVLDKFSGKKPLENKMVGFDDQLNQVLKKLTGNQPNLVIVPIVGMGGIGKTTLARSLFDHPYNLDRFQVRVWLTISQDYSVAKVLQGLLADGVLLGNEDGEGDENKLIMQLHQKLFGQTYLIVLDDVWSLEAWYDLKRGFPDNGRGSLVMVTTRLSDIANSLDSRNNSYAMKFLDEDKSWALFSEKAFEKGGRSLELEEIGREISKRCNGLPILLVLIGRLLANSDMTVEYWKTVKENINSFANSANDEYCLKILSLSYHHLPIHLKPCFLSARHFEEDSDVKVSDLLKAWVSEGFVKPMTGKSMEEAARKYLEELIGRNMFLVRKRSKAGNIKICGIHDLLRDLCIKESDKEQLLQPPKSTFVKPSDIKDKCVICRERIKDTSALYSEILGSMCDGKILMCSCCKSTYPGIARSRFVGAVKFKYENTNNPLLTTCRSIVIYRVGSVSSTIRLVWNLLFLDIERRGVDLPKEIWEMPQLRQVNVWSFKLPDPISAKNDVVIVLKNLETFTKIIELKFTEEVVRRIPNIRKLHMQYDNFETDEQEDGPCFYLRNLARLQMLEWLCVSFRSTVDFEKVIAFPRSLKTLILQCCNISWEDLTIIGSLPNLESLKFSYQSVSGEEWNPVEGEFLRLKYLKLEGLDLVRWRVDGTTHFPALETIYLNYMHCLEAFPREIGELPSLNLIYLKDYNENIIDSARAVVEERLSYGNERPAVRVLNQDWAWVDLSNW